MFSRLAGSTARGARQLTDTVERAAKRILLALLSDSVYTARHGVAKGLRRRGGFGFLPQRVRPVTAEETFLRSLDLRGQTVYDIGGNQGVFTLFFARAVGPDGHVVTFEPNPASCRSIRENVRLNGFENVDLRKLALGRHAASATLLVDPLDPGRGYIPHRNPSPASDRVEKLTVEIDSLDHQVEANDLRLPDLIKIDTEGSESEILLGAQGTLERVRPALFLEMHGSGIEDKIKNARAIVDFLDRAGYSLRHVEAGVEISPGAIDEALRGHLYCRPH